MIVGLIGEVIKKEPTYLHINVKDIVYEVFVSLNTSSAIKQKHVRLHTTLIVREDAQILYGFIDMDEKRMFDRLIKLNGVGPKVAIAICSTFKPSEFVQVVQEKSVAKLKKVPGIGPKSAQRILVELGEFTLSGENVQSSAQQEAALALQTLGFKKEQIDKVLSQCESTDTASLVKEALKKIQKL